MNSARIYVMPAVFAAVAVLFLIMPRSVDAAALTVSTLTATSSNASTTLSKVGDTINFQLILSGTPHATSTPVINIFSMGSTSMTGSGANWIYSTTSASSWTEGLLSYRIGYGGSASGDATTTITQSSMTGPNIRFDKTAPTLSNVTVQSSNSSTTLAKVNDVITLTATSSENIGNAATITIGGNSATFSLVTASTTWKGTYTVQSGDTNGDASISVAFADASGNSGTTVTSVSAGNLVFIDTTAPTLTVLGSNPDRVDESTSEGYTDAGASATDNHDASVTPVTSGSVTRSTPGSYTLTYVATDTAGNASTSTRPVTVSDVNSNSTGSGGGGGGGGNPRPAPAPAPAPTPPAPTPSSQILALVAQLRTLITTFESLGGTVSPQTKAVLDAFPPAKVPFDRDLSIGLTGEDVKQLQIFLNANGFTVAVSGPGSAGNETTMFGGATRAALMKFQKEKGITPASGYLGPKTRAAINGM